MGTRVTDREDTPRGSADADCSINRMEFRRGSHNLHGSPSLYSSWGGMAGRSRISWVVDSCAANARETIITRMDSATNHANHAKTIRGGHYRDIIREQRFREALDRKGGRLPQNRQFLAHLIEKREPEERG